MSGLWLDELKEGQVRESGTYLMSAEEIVRFASAYDPQPFHLSDEGAVGTIFGTLAASGWHTAAVTMRLLVDTLQLAEGSVGLGVDLAWPSPARPGDELRVVVTVTSVRPSRSRPGMGVVELTYDTLNQADEVRQHTVARALVRARGAS